MTFRILTAAARLLAIIVATRLLMTRTGTDVQTTDIHLSVPGIFPASGGVRVAMLSDLHVGKLNVPPERLVAAVDAAGPDLLLLGGDYSARLTDRDDALKLIARLSAGRPTFAVLGNTDHYQDFDSRALRATLRPGGGDLLVNGVGRADVRGIAVEILGVDDPLHNGSDLNAVVAEASGEADLRIGLCHSPALWRELSRLRAQITLFGHTHGGQVRLPGMEAPVTHLTYPRELAAGLFRYEDGAELPRRLADHWEILDRREPLRVSAAGGPLMYVTRGVGMGGPPMRLLCPPELVSIEFESDDADGADGDDG